jgi:hypothetical protein
MKCYTRGDPEVLAPCRHPSRENGSMRANVRDNRRIKKMKDNRGKGENVPKVVRTVDPSKQAGH